ncbi:MAG: co-chaperone GroES [Actinobacteria bacterium]|nr:co-chaperone GroES [Actinomycetota bacterium]MBI3688794.1 co-chaperone GroES [Actinomycetota bacterium]
MLHDRVLAKVPGEDGERRSAAGIVLPATAQVGTRLQWAEVLAVGQHVRSVEAGDQVLFSPEDQHDVEVQGRQYVILRERDIHAMASRRIEPATGLYL